MFFEDKGGYRIQILKLKEKNREKEEHFILSSDKIYRADGRQKEVLCPPFMCSVPLRGEQQGRLL